MFLYLYFIIVWLSIGKKSSWQSTHIYYIIREGGKSACKSISTSELAMPLFNKEARLVQMLGEEAVITTLLSLDLEDVAVANEVGGFCVRRKEESDNKRGEYIIYLCED